MIGVGVGGDFHQARLRHLANLLPRQELSPWSWRTGKIHRLVQRRVDPGPHRCQQCRPVVGTQNRHHAGVEAGITVIEAEHHRLGRQCRAAAPGCQDLVDADRLVAVFTQPRQLLDQTLGAHRHHGLIGVAIFYVVIGNAQKWFFGHGASLGAIGRSAGGV